MHSSWYQNQAALPDRSTTTGNLSRSDLLSSSQQRNNETIQTINPRISSKKQKKIIMERGFYSYFISIALSMCEMWNGVERVGHTFFLNTETC